MRSSPVLLLPLAAVLLPLLPPDRASASPGEPWSVAVFAGPGTHNNSTKVFLQGDWRTDFEMAGLALTRDLWQLPARWKLQAEGYAGLQFPEEGSTTGEFDLFLALRRDGVLRFGPHRLDLAAGYGPSWLTKAPKQDDVARNLFLSGVFVELALSLRPDSPWEALFRWQHRSSTFGLYSDDEIVTASNAFVLGLRRSFSLGP